MGNRAVIAFKTDELSSIPESYRPAIYLHWNGSRDSIEAFLQSARDAGIRSGAYGVARLTQLIANYIGGTLSIGVTCYCLTDKDNHDNGVYWIDDGFNIVGREYHQGADDNINLFDPDFKVNPDLAPLVQKVKAANLNTGLALDNKR
tara:strand:+ start:82 stop:522 length:441 start_codon:yes stop_codon:yes gene_type:complete